VPSIAAKSPRPRGNRATPANEIMKMIDKIREPIKSMGESNLAHTTKYIQNLSKLSLHYAGNEA
jgi:hypothetical protein